MTPLANAVAAQPAPSPRQVRPSAYADNRRAVADASRDATAAFLWRFGVCGIGVSHYPAEGSRIVFLLLKESSEARRVVAQWAEERGVPVEFKISANGHA